MKAKSRMLAMTGPIAAMCLAVVGSVHAWDDSGAEPQGPLDVDDGAVAAQDIDGIEVARDQVYVEWCDLPNSAMGTICRRYDNNLINYDDIDECRVDSYSVCGRPTNYWHICDRAGCVYLGPA